MSAENDAQAMLLEQEWQAQERALAEERLGIASGTARDSSYHVLARALLHPPINPIPADFAAKTAAKVLLNAGSADERFEVWLQYIAIALLLLAGTVAAVRFSNIWIQAFADLEHIQWLVLAGLCVLVSSALGHVRHFRSEQ